MNLGIIGPLMAGFGLPAVLFPQMELPKVRYYLMVFVVACVLVNLYLLYAF